MQLPLKSKENSEQIRLDMQVLPFQMEGKEDLKDQIYSIFPPTWEFCQLLGVCLFLL